MQQAPVSKEPGIAQGSLANPVSGSPGAPLQAFVFRHGPAREAPVQIAQRRVKCRFVITTRSCLAFSRNAHHLDHWDEAASGGLNPDPATRVREAGSHLSCSKAAQKLFKS